MAKKEMDWLHTNICRYCGNRISYKSNSERVICRTCKRVNYKNEKVKFENELKRKILKERKNGKN